MKEERQQDVNEQQPQQNMKEMQRKVEHPQQQYSVHELFSIRKESANMANEQIYKKLTKSFQRIKKIRAEPNASQLIAKEYDYESNPIRLLFKRSHELYNQATKTNLIVKRKIDKMRGKVDRIKAVIENSELNMITEVDINKIFSRGTQVVQGQGANSNGQQIQGSNGVGNGGKQK